jgi:uncharacterized protein YbjQ (UPF0145 family)
VLEPMKTIDLSFITTAFELPGHRIVRNVGVVRGIVVRSRSIVGAIGASLQTLLGGNITLFTALCEKARTDAFELMLRARRRARRQCHHRRALRRQ